MFSNLKLSTFFVVSSVSRCRTSPTAYRYKYTTIYSCRLIRVILYLIPLTIVWNYHIRPRKRFLTYTPLPRTFPMPNHKSPLSGEGRGDWSSFRSGSGSVGCVHFEETWCHYGYLAVPSFTRWHLISRADWFPWRRGMRHRLNRAPPSGIKQIVDVLLVKRRGHRKFETAFELLRADVVSVCGWSTLRIFPDVSVIGWWDTVISSP